MAFVSRESPFLNEYHSASDDESPVPSDEGAYGDIARELFAELGDDELDDAIHELVDEASDVRLQEMDGEVPDAANEARVEQVLRAHFEPLARESEAMVARARELSDLSHEEFEAALDELEVPITPSPAFEQFFSALKKKLRKVAGGAFNLAKRGLTAVAGPIIRRALDKLKAIVRPLLEKVIQLAFDRIPPRFRPYLRKLADKLGLNRVIDRVTALGDRAAANVIGALGAPQPSSAQNDTSADHAAVAASSSPPPASNEPSTPSASEVQDELDLEMVDSLLGRESRDDETRADYERDEPARDPFRALDVARERFIGELAALEEGEDAGPAVEHFLPAVMLALRLGIKLIGRPRVVDFLGDLLGKLIAPLAGKEIAPQLGRLVADIGLKTILHAEMGDEDPRRLAAEALVSTVEETVRRVASLPDEVLSEPLLFEACTHEAFDVAAAANLPSQLLRPELRELGLASTWMHLPRRGPKLYKKLGHAIDVTIAPHTAAAIATFDGSPLSAFFRDRLRLTTGEPVHARAHLFEAIPRTRLSRIASRERLHGLGSSQRWAWSQIHPLTSDAASLLLGAPRLGRDLEDEADPSAPQVGERYYFLEVDEAPSRPLGSASHAHITLNLAKNTLHVCLFMSEVVAQKIASALRRKAGIGAIIGELRSVYAGIVGRILHGKAKRAFRIRGLNAAPHAHSAAAKLAHHALRRHLAARAFAWSWVAIAKELETNGPAFLRAADDPQEGVRIDVTFALPRGREIAKAFAGDGKQAVTIAPNPAPAATIRMTPGARHG